MISPLLPPAEPSTPSDSTSPSPASSTLPRPVRLNGKTKLLVLVVVVVCLPLVSGAAWLLFGGWAGHRPDLILHNVKRERLELTIVERGAVESAYNNDIACRVESGQKGGGYATTIKWIIEDGSLVKNDKEFSYPLPAGADRYFELEPSLVERRVLLALETGGAPVDAAIVVADNVAEAKQALRNQSLAGSVFQALTQVDPQVEALIPAGSGFVVALGNHSKLPATVAGKLGDLLVKFDDSALKDQEKTQKIATEQANAARIAAEANLQIVESQAKSDEATARVTLALAELDLNKYVKGDHPKLLKDALSRKEIAESDLEMWRDRSAWSERMSKKGYLSQSQVQAERSRLRSAELALQSLEEELRVLDLTREREVKNLSNLKQEAERALNRVIIQNQAKIQQAKTDLMAKVSVAEQEAARYKKIREELKKCMALAPQDGMVVYFVEESRRSSTRQAMVAQGEPVNEGQKLMRIPDLRHMQVQAKVHEALVSKVKTDQPAIIRVDAFPSRIIPGRVKQVATVASQADWFSSDVKVYQCTVALDEYVEGLKPGMSAEVTILIGNVLENVLTVPVHAIVGSAEMGKDRLVYVLTPNGAEERRIEVGQSNDRMAEVRTGLQEGDRVVVNPRAILGDTAKVREPGVQKVRISYDRDSGDGPPPSPKGPKASGGPEVKAAPPAGKTKTTAKAPKPEKKKGPVSAE